MNKKVFFVLAIILVAISILFINFYFKPVSAQEKEIYVEVVAEKKVGFNLETDKLYFGSLPAGGSATRNITISNSGSKKRFIVSVEGPIKDWISADKSAFVLRDGENASIQITLTVPERTTPGNYTSKIKVYAYYAL